MIAHSGPSTCRRGAAEVRLASGHEPQTAGQNQYIRSYMTGDSRRRLFKIARDASESATLLASAWEAVKPELKTDQLLDLLAKEAIC